jgi:glycosyltransferase involved in cell wall biosynthesis
VRSLSRGERARRRHELAARGIAWHALRYHKRPSLLATLFDVVAGIAFGTLLVRRHRLDALHARSHVPAVMGLAIRQLTGCRLIFDIRGLMAQEYVDTGNWAPGGVPARLTAAVERRAKWSAEGAVVLTHAVVPVLWGEAGRPNLQVIPCCADLEAIKRRHKDRDRCREQLGLADRTVLIYTGKLGGWYMEREMVEFFAASRREIRRAHLLILTQSDRRVADAEARRAGVAADEYSVLECPPEELGSYLAAADAAIALIRRLPSKVASSPTKIGEYLGAGLPTIATAGIGDIDAFLAHRQAGVLLEATEPASYARAARELRALIETPDTAERCRRAAREKLSLSEVGVPRYDALYRGIAALRNC